MVILSRPINRHQVSHLMKVTEPSLDYIILELILKKESENALGSVRIISCRQPLEKRSIFLPLKGRYIYQTPGPSAQSSSLIQQPAASPVSSPAIMYRVENISANGTTSLITWECTRMKNLFRVPCLAARSYSTRLAIRKSTWILTDQGPFLNAQSAGSGLIRPKSLTIITLTIKVIVITEDTSCFSYYSCEFHSPKYMSRYILFLAEI